VVHVVLSALETHGMSNAIVNSCVKTLMIFDAAEVVDAASELRSVDTIITIAKRSMRFPEILSNILDLFMIWSANADMVELLVDSAVPFAITMVSHNSGERNLLVLVCSRCVFVALCPAAVFSAVEMTVQVYRLLFNIAKTGGKSAVQTLADAGIIKTFANLCRCPHHPEYIWDGDLILPVIMVLKLLTSCDQRRVAEMAVQGGLSVAFSAAMAYTLAGDKKLVDMGALW
jgi:hypothetical protein